MGLIKNTTAESIGQGLQQGNTTGDIVGGDWKGELIADRTPILKAALSMNKDRRILVQGILQAVVQSQGLLLEPGGTWEERVEQATLRFVKFVEEQSR